MQVYLVRLAFLSSTQPVKPIMTFILKDKNLSRVLRLVYLLL